MRGLFSTLALLIALVGFGQNDSGQFLQTTPLEPDYGLWEDVVLVKKEPFLLKNDTFAYTIQGVRFNIVQHVLIDSVLFEKDDKLWLMLIDTIYEQTPIGQPEEVLLELVINEPLIDTLRDPDDPSRILAVDTVLPPIPVEYNLDFHFVLEDFEEISSKLSWSKKLAEEQPGLKFKLFQIDKFSNRYSTKGLMEDLIEQIESLWKSCESSMYLTVYTVSTHGHRYPHLSFSIYLNKQ